MKTSLANGNLSVLLLQERTFSIKAVIRVETCHTSCQRGVISYSASAKQNGSYVYSKQERAVTEALLPSATNCADIYPCCDHLYFSTLVGLADTQSETFDKHHSQRAEKEPILPV